MLLISDLIYTLIAILLTYALGTKLFGYSLGDLINITLRISGV